MVTQRQTENKIIVVTRKTRLDELVSRFNTVSQAKFYVEHLGADFSDYLSEHRRYREAVAETERILRQIGRVQMVDRSYLAGFLFGDNDTIVVLGQDGLVANTVKYSSMQPIIGVNPDPDRWDGILLPFQVPDLPKIIPEVFEGRRRVKEVTMAKATLNNGQTLHAVNDFFIGVKSHTSARYVIQVGARSEQQSSSGIIVSTGLGSTGWLKSLVTGALAIASETSGREVQAEQSYEFAWDADHLFYTVREPFPTRTSSASLIFGRITAAVPLVLVSQTPERGVIFSDGIESDFLEFSSGTQAVITVAEKKGHLVV